MSDVRPTEIAGEERRGRKGVLSRLRPASPPLKEIEGLLRVMRSSDPRADTKTVVRAFEMALSAHEGQVRKSGERFIEHPLGVARIVAEQEMDTTTVVAALLHDAVEDTQLGLEDIRTAFGDEVAGIIDGLTKIEHIGFRSKEQERAGNLRKMIVAMAKDIRVLVIKIADRLHNMRTLGALDLARRELIAAETLEIYAPLAHRLGMQRVKAELEDLAFEALHPKRYEEVEQMVTQRAPAREDHLGQVVAAVSAQLREVKVRAEVSGRPKHYYSIYEKMVRRGRHFEEILDLVGVRIIVGSVKDCYAALGAIHALWRPVPGRFKDYIAMPKFNLYQSLHTSVIGPGGKALEIQIRTNDMHRIAEWGVASHLRYKEGTEGPAADEQTAWLMRMVEHEQTEDDREFLESLRLDLFSDEVFVFTPKGDVLELPKGASPIDFAYAIHTEVGHACVGARVNGRLVPLDFRLSSGETVEVITSRTGTGPSRDWLEIVVTPRARTKIRQWFTKERREEAIVEGREALTRALRRAGASPRKFLNESSLAEIAAELKLSGPEALFADVGEGRQSAQSLAERILRRQAPELEEPDEIPAPTRVRTRPPSTQGVIVKGVDDILVKLARCCMPVPGDPIIGFVTRGRGVSIHRPDCPNAGNLSTQGERFVDVAWDPVAPGPYPVSVGVEALDRPKLLRDVTTAISDFGINITSATSNVGQGIARLRFTFELADASQLPSILAAMRKVEAVYDAYRITPQRR